MRSKAMKRTAAFILALAVLACFAGCGLPAEPETSPPPTAAPAQTAPETEAPTEAPAEPPTEPSAAPTEALDLPEPEDADLVLVRDYIPQIRQELAYASVDNFTGQRIYDFTDAYLRYGTAKKLKAACEELAQLGLGLKIWDAFRPVSAQERLWEICPDPTYVSNPATGTRSHCRGSAVDVTLVDLETGEELAVPTGFDDFTDLADRDYSDCAPDAAQNAALLEEIMEKHGFKPYSAEWWHFSDTDDYPVDESFDPAMPALWLADCEEYVTLRADPKADAQEITRIPAGETLELLEWAGRFAKIAWQGETGYIMSACMKPLDGSYLADILDTVAPTDVYSYDQMTADMEALAAAYPEQVSLEVIGKSEVGRQIPVLRLGSQDAQYHVLLHGAIHGREHMTAWLLMAMADYWLDHGLSSYGDVCYHIIPMANPDGVIISQTAKLSAGQTRIYNRDTELAYTDEEITRYASLWKANALGVDINRNFPSGWDLIDDRTFPSAERYQGEEPFSSAEARVLRDYTLAYDFDATISYHASGSTIFYEYGSKEPVNSQSQALGQAVQAVTGYILAGSTGVDGAGYKDWAMDELGIPSLTVEVGCEDAPLAQQEVYSIFARNYRVLPAIARWLQSEQAE